MKARLILMAIAGLLFTAAADSSGPVRWIFEDAPADKLPAGWSVGQTGEGPISVWRVIEDPAAASGKQVLAQLAAYGPNPLFNLCVCDESNLQNLDVSVSVKAVKGKLDQGGGLIWRYRDANNYYLARVNPLEDNFRVYKVDDGKRTELASAAVKTLAGQWDTIRVTHQGNHIQGYFNGRLHLDVKDDTFSETGPVGLWTKADAVTSFDDFTYRAK